MPYIKQEDHTHTHMGTNISFSSPSVVRSLLQDSVSLVSRVRDRSAAPNEAI